MSKLKVLEDLSGVERYSFSKLSTIWQCPYEYYLTYRVGSRGAQNDFAECGSFVHDILEKYLKGELHDYELRDYFLNNFESCVPDGVKLILASGHILDLTETYVQQISSFLENFNGFTVNGKSLRVIDAEKDFYYLVKLGKKILIMNGILDVVAVDDDGEYYIIDHKSKKEFVDDAEKKKYARQLYLYSVYIKQKYGKYPKALVFNMFRRNRLEIIPFKEEDFAEAIEWMEKSVGKIEQESIYLPVDFSEELADVEKTYLPYANLDYFYGTKDEERAIRGNFQKAKKQFEDKLFFCINLCGHRDSCSTWSDARNEYRRITSGKGES